MTTDPALSGEWRFAVVRDPDSGSHLWSLTIFRRSGEEWAFDQRIPLPMVDGMQGDQIPGTSDAPTGLGADVPRLINGIALAVVSQLAAVGADVLGGEWDHGHCTMNTDFRWTESW